MKHTYTKYTKEITQAELDRLESRGYDVEEEFAKILDEEIWREITLETGRTKQDLDNEIIAQIQQLKAEGKLKTRKPKKTKVKKIYSSAVNPAYDPDVDPAVDAPAM